MTQVVVEYERRDPQGRRGRSDRRHGRDRCQLPDQVVGDDEDVDPEPLRPAGGLGEFTTGGDGAGFSQEAERTHPGIVPSGSSGHEFDLHTHC